MAVTGKPARDVEFAYMPCVGSTQVRAGVRTELRLGEPWGDAWGVWARSEVAFDDVRRHMRRFLRVQGEDGRRMLFRWYDPRVLRVYLPSCTDDERRALDLETHARARIRGRDPAVARRLLEGARALLARGRSPAARAALARAVSDPAEEVQRVALTSIGASRDAAVVDAVVAVLRSSPRWSVRILAARALAAMPSPEARGALTLTVRSDTFAMVREAALESLARIDRPAAIALAKERIASEPEPRVRESARAIANRSP